MPVFGLEHVNIRTADLQGTLAFFRDVLSMDVRPPPGRTSVEDGAWVYDANGMAVVHVASSAIAYPSDAKLPFEPGRGSGSLHHVALKCSNFDETLARLRKLGVECFENHLPAYKLRQIFVSDPNGILFELNFADPT